MSAAVAEAVLPQTETKDLLRLSTAGSVDDGKSTLIGRLLYDSNGAYEDQIASIRRSGVNRSTEPFDLSLLTDGLRAEREQGITIDVAYRYFTTPRRKFIIADTPGHEEYTRNMATGASTANLAIILIDARNGVLPQSRRHVFIASMLAIQHVVVAVNKMDLVGYSQAVFDRICSEFSDYVASLQIPDLHFIPISALKGDNVVHKSRNMLWFEGASLLHYLETVHIASDRNMTEFRFPVQYVLRPDARFRGYAGQVAAGVLQPGDAVMALPSRRTTRIRSIVTYDGELPKAFPPMSVTVCLENELDVSRGDMLVPPSHPPHVTRQIDARMVWMSEQPLKIGREYLLKHTSQTTYASVRAVRYRVQVDTLQKERANSLLLNDIGAVVIDSRKPVFCDAYRRNRVTGSFILIDPETNATVAAGMITGREPSAGGRGPAVVWLEGGREAVYALEKLLLERNFVVYALFLRENDRFFAQIARILAEGGVTVLAHAPEDDCLRETARELIGRERFLAISAEMTAGDPTEAAARIARALEEARAL